MISRLARQPWKCLNLAKALVLDHMNRPHQIILGLHDGGWGRDTKLSANRGNWGFLVDPYLNSSQPESRGFIATSQLGEEPFWWLLLGSQCERCKLGAKTLQRTWSLEPDSRRTPPARDVMFSTGGRHGRCHSQDGRLFSWDEKSLRQWCCKSTRRYHCKSRLAFPLCVKGKKTDHQPSHATTKPEPP